MEISQKEALGFLVSLVCASLILFSLFNVGFFNGIKTFIESSTQSKIVKVVNP